MVLVLLPWTVACARLGRLQRMVKMVAMISTWTVPRAPLERLPVTMVDELVAEGGQGDYQEQ